MNSFISRVKPDNTNPEKVDYIKLIDEVLGASEFNRLIQDSPVYLLAIQQYNDQVKKNTLVRKQVPNWFCGRIEPATGILITDYTDQELRTINGYSTTILAPVSATQSTLVISYKDDACLKSGTPGSDGYAICDPNIRNVNSSFTSVLCGIEFDTMISLIT